MGADARLTGRAVWETHHLPAERDRLHHHRPRGAAAAALARARHRASGWSASASSVSLVLVVVRALWIFPSELVTPLVRGEPRPPRLLAHSLVLSWAGMRGVVSLAVALALPLTLPGGAPFPAREALLIVTVTVIVFTLLGQGLTPAVADPQPRPGHRPGAARGRSPRPPAARRGRHAPDRPALPGVAGPPPAARPAARDLPAPVGARRAAARRRRAPAKKTGRSSNTARSSAPSSTRSARRSCACARRARSMTTCCARSSGSWTSTSAGSTPEVQAPVAARGTSALRGGWPRSGRPP